jgi:hypothetical protein
VDLRDGGLSENERIRLLHAIGYFNAAAAQYCWSSPYITPSGKHPVDLIASARKATFDDVMKEPSTLARK